jgi:hypothetical protein
LDGFLREYDQLLSTYESLREGCSARKVIRSRRRWAFISWKQLKNDWSTLRRGNVISSDIPVFDAMVDELLKYSSGHRRALRELNLVNLRRLRRRSLLNHFSALFALVAIVVPTVAGALELLSSPTPDNAIGVAIGAAAWRTLKPLILASLILGPAALIIFPPLFEKVQELEDIFAVVAEIDDPDRGAGSKAALAQNARPARIV